METRSDLNEGGFKYILHNGLLVIVKFKNTYVCSFYFEHLIIKTNNIPHPTQVVF